MIALITNHIIAFTLVHVVLSVIGIVAGLIAAGGLVSGRWQSVRTKAS